MSIITGRKLKRFRDGLTTIFANKSIYGDDTINLGRASGSVIGPNSVVLGGSSNTAKKDGSATLGGANNGVNAIYAAILAGFSISVNGSYSAALGGKNNTVNGERSIALGGNNNSISGDCAASVGGTTLTVGAYQVGLGHFNDISKSTDGTTSGAGTGTAFFIGNGGNGIASNAIRMDYNGKMWCKSAYSSTGADYAELFEWLDKNLNNEVRYGYFVTMVGTKIKKANAGDWILGIVSANPCILGNTDMEWQGQFLKDKFGAFIMEDITVTEKRLQPKLGENGEQVYEQVPVTDSSGNPLFDKDGQPAFTENPVFEEVEVEVSGQFYKVNPDYDPDQEYIDRISRPEWDAIGMMGVLSVYDDGSCQVDGYCTVADGGIATASSFGYRVIERVTENIVKVIINAESSNMVLALMNRINLLEQQINELSA